MKIVIIGGSGLIGSKLGKQLKSLGHEVLSASPSSGVDAVTGKGLKEALEGASVVVDVSNSPAFDEKAASEFFEKSSRNLASAEKEAHVKHHVALSVVGTGKLGGYFQAKNIQEKLIKASGIPYTIVQSTQFFEFINSIIQSATEGQTIRLPPVLFQPIAADDVASILADIALKPPLNQTIEIGGPKCAPFPELIQDYLNGNEKRVIADLNAHYFGNAVSNDSLVPGKNPLLGTITLENWRKNSSK